MGSTVPTDIIQSGFGAPSNMSSMSLSCASRQRQAMEIATSASRNISSGSAVQINGPVADNIYNINIKTLVVTCQESWDSDIDPPKNKSTLPNGRTAKTLKVRNVLEASAASKVSAKFTAQLPKIVSERSVLQGLNLTLNSSMSDSRRVVRAIFRPNVPNNFIAHRIVHKLGLVVYGHYWSSMEVNSVDIHLPATKDYVDIGCYSSEQKDNFVVYRFFVVKHDRFDLLFGADSGKS